MRKIVSLAVMAIVALASCNRTDSDESGTYEGVAVGTEYVAGISISTAGIEVDKESVGAGIASLDENSILSENATIAIQIKDLQIEEADKQVIAKGYYNLFTNMDFNRLLDDLTVTLKNGYKYSIEASIFSEPADQCVMAETESESPIYTDGGNQAVMTDAEDFTAEANIADGFQNLSKKSNGGKGIRYYYSGDYVASFSNPILNINLKLASYKVTYAFKNIAWGADKKVKTWIGDEAGSIIPTEEEYVTDQLTEDGVGANLAEYRVKEEWYEFDLAEKEYKKSIDKIAIGLYPTTGLVIKEFVKKGFSKDFVAGYNYTIRTDFGVETGLNISVDQTGLIGSEDIDLK